MEIEELLEQVQEIKSRYDDKKIHGENFNIFDICVKHDEVKNSAILAEFLNPKGGHGRGSVFLEKFIEVMKNKIGCFPFDFDFENTEVQTETSIQDFGRIDILLKSKGCAIIIENKIYASDQSEQLKRYEEWAEGVFKDKFVILYLTLDGKKASEQSAGGVDYTPISYSQDILEWLQKCEEEAKDVPSVYEVLKQYKQQIKNLTGQGMNEEMKKEIAEVLLQGNNLELAEAISQSKEIARKKMIQDVVFPIFEEIEIDGWKCEVSKFDEFNKLEGEGDDQCTVGGIEFRKDGLESYVRFDFYGSNFQGLCIVVENYKERCWEKLSDYYQWDYTTLAKINCNKEKFKDYIKLKLQDRISIIEKKS